MEPVRIKNSEWNVLSCLWEKSPQTVMQLVARLRETVGWAKSTTITTLRRMEEKGRQVRNYWQGEILYTCCRTRECCDCGNQEFFRPRLSGQRGHDDERDGTPARADTRGPC